MSELPYDARDRIQRVLRAYDGHTIPEVAHHIMRALAAAPVPACGLAAEHDPHPFFYGWPREAGYCGGTTRQGVSQ